MKKNLLLTLALVLSSLSAGAMQGPGKAAILQLHAENKSITSANEAQYKSQPYFTLNIMQPTSGYRTLNSCVNYLLKSKKFPKGYSKIPDNDWHISTIVIAVPFQGAANQQEVVRASKELGNIIKSYKPLLAGVTYEFNSFESLGNHKFIAGQYDFKDRTGKINFLTAYAQIINEFLRKYPEAWMFFGYTTIPHISVARTRNPGGKVLINTAGCNPINDVTLLHNGRNLYISSGYYDPTARKMQFLQSPPL